MNPEEWEQAVQNEAEHAQDAGWAQDAAPFVRGLAWRSNCSALGYGLLIILVYTVLDWSLTPMLLNLNPSPAPKLNLTSVPLSVTALGVAWLLGYKGYRAWPIVLTFAVLAPAELVINHVLNVILPSAGMRFELGYGQEFYPNFWVTQLIACGLMVLLALLAVHLGNHHARRAALR